MADLAPGLSLQCRGNHCGERALWSAVVQQALADLDGEPLGSLVHNAAVAFFFGRGEWARSRFEVADELDVHADDLERCGRRHLLARQAAEGLPLEQLPALWPTKPPAPLPRLEAVFLRPPTPKGGSWQKRHGRNPFRFDAAAPLPSERKSG